MFSPSSDISFLEYAYDVGEEQFLSINEFELEGKPKFNLFASALLGLETVFFEHIGFLFEIKSGLGIQLLANESSFGLAKNAYHAGLNYYLFDYKRKPLPNRSWCRFRWKMVLWNRSGLAIFKIRMICRMKARGGIGEV